jgi:putative Mg2+ transporter-C (MgtC) family protein
MISIEQMILRLAVAMILGAIIGLERELIGKEAGIRTCMMVSAGAAIFSMIALSLPYIVAISPENIPDIIARNSGFLGAIANIVVGIGFLGAGIIIKTEERVRGVTTAALIWVVASIGTLAGIGLIKFGVTAAALIAVTLYLLRNVNLGEKIARPNGQARK